MAGNTKPSESEQHYSRVREDHDDHADLPGALRAYAQLIESHPETPEAERAREWIHRIRALRVRLADGREMPVSDVLALRWDLPPVETGE